MSAALALPAREVVIPYAPRRLQREIHEGVWFNRRQRRTARKRWGQLVCHRRFGKSVLGINHMIRGAATFDGNDAKFAYIAPLLKQAKNIAWDYLKHFTSPFGDARKVNESELWVKLPNGARIQVLGADKPDSLRGAYLDGVVLDEFGQMHRSVWGQIVRPMLSDRPGYALILGTPKGRNEFHRLYQVNRDDPEWYVRLLPLSQTDVLDADERAALLREVAKGTLTQAEYDQEYECSWSAAMRGSFYGVTLDKLEAQGRMKPFEVEPTLPVTTAWDLGMRDATAIWFMQIVGNEVRIIDFAVFHGAGLPAIAKALREKPYVYDEHLLPHDVEVRELGTGVSRIETLHRLGISARVIPRINARTDFEEDERIEAVRNMLPRCYFNTGSPGVREGLEGLRLYRREENERTGELSARPEHDWASDYADAFGHLAQGITTRIAPTTRPRINLRAAAPT